MAQRTTNNPPFGWKFNGDVVDDITELYGNLPTYKKYVALITQSGTNAPTAEVLENTLGFTPTFSYDGVGSYIIESPNSNFTVSKTVTMMTASGASSMEIASIDADEIFIISRDHSGTATNGLMSKMPIEIIVYD